MYLKTILEILFKSHTNHGSTHHRLAQIFLWLLCLINYIYFYFSLVDLLSRLPLVDFAWPNKVDALYCMNWGYITPLLFCFRWLDRDWDLLDALVSLHTVELESKLKPPRSQNQRLWAKLPYVTSPFLPDLIFWTFSRVAYTGISCLLFH